MWIWLIIIAFAVAAVLVLGSIVQSQNRRRQQYAEATRRWIATPGADREAAMRSLLDPARPSGPAWYLCGCACLADYRCKQAARAFGMAHHMDCNLETAALLSFACLKASDGPASDLIEQITITWQEMKEPDLLQHREDRLMLDCLETTSGLAPTTLSALGRCAWLVVGPGLRNRVAQLIAGGDSRWAPLRRS